MLLPWYLFKGEGLVLSKGRKRAKLGDVLPLLGVLGACLGDFKEGVWYD